MAKGLNLLDFAKGFPIRKTKTGLQIVVSIHHNKDGAFYVQAVDPDSGKLAGVARPAEGAGVFTVLGYVVEYLERRMKKVYKSE